VPRTSPYLEEILRLDPVGDHKRITHLVTCYEFPFDTTRSLELAFFRTYAVPAIGTLLDPSGEFAARPQKRYDDTDLIIGLMIEDGYDGETGNDGPGFARLCGGAATHAAGRSKSWGPRARTARVRGPLALFFTAQ